MLMKKTEFFSNNNYFGITTDTWTDKISNRNYLVITSLYLNTEKGSLERFVIAIIPLYVIKNN